MSPKPTVVSVTIHQYKLTGMLVKPLSAPSIIYIAVPKMRQRISTANRKTEIFARLSFNACIKRSPSPMYLLTFKILKTRSKRKALTVINALPLPGNKKETYSGMVEKKSIKP